jgi:hypothetical protein
MAERCEGGFGVCEVASCSGVEAEMSDDQHGATEVAWWMLDSPANPSAI